MITEISIRVSIGGLVIDELNFLEERNTTVAHT